MNVNIRRIISLFMVILLTFGCFSLSAAAADAKAVLEFGISDDGYAVVKGCSTSAKGVISIPSSVTINGKSYNIRYIGDRAFDKCKAVTEIKIPEGVTAIGSAAFRNCTGLTEVYIPESLIRCELDAFDGCSGVVVHCYTSNYQFIMLYGSYSDIVLDIIDEDNLETEEPETDDDILDDLGIIGRFITALKNLIQNLLDHFNVNLEDDFSIEDLPIELPFDIGQLV